MGGGYGSKFVVGVEGLAVAELAKKAKAPVKLMLDRESEITTAGNRPSAQGTVKIAGKKTGEITAFEVMCHGTGGYRGGQTVTINLLPYVYLDAIPNIKRNHSAIRTNCGSAQAMRAPNHPQNSVLTEFAVDDLAAKLGIDPLIMRRKNLPPADKEVAAKNPLAWLAIRNKLFNDQIDIATRMSKWSEKWHPPGEGKGPIKRGIGMGLHTWGGNAVGGPPSNEVTVIISRDGSVTVESSTQDLGTGQRTVSAIVTAEILGLDVNDIVVKIGESNLGFSSGSGGSTTLPSQGPATLRAATAARDDLFAKIGKKLNIDPKTLEIQAGKVVQMPKGQSWTWKEFCAKLGMDEVKARGDWNVTMAGEPENANVSSGQVGGCQVAEVTVDTETGVVKVTHIYAVQDCGMLINKLACESQVAGGVIMGVNYAMFEERIMDRTTGRQVNPDMEFYKLGGIKDIPRIHVEMMDMPERGVIGIGEPPTISTAAAIGNAVFNAIGVRVPVLPLTPQRVLDALAKKTA
jgi:xanthine dehydrogenase YagR molybdenum-binding subunit